MIPLRIGIIRLLSLCAIAFFLPISARGQHADGVVRDRSGSAITHAYVTLLDVSQELAAAVLTDTAGVFRVGAPAPGFYYLRVTRIGYRTLMDGPYAIDRGAPLEVRVVMHPLSPQLEAIEVTADRHVARLAAVGYYQRKAAGFGWFVEREEIQSMGAVRVTDVLERLPGISVSYGPPGGLNPTLVIRGGGAGACSPTVYLDGVVAAQGGAIARRPVRPDDWVSPDQVQAIEVYPGPSSAPTQFQALSQCGVLLIWTRHAGVNR